MNVLFRLGIAGQTEKKGLTSLFKEVRVSKGHTIGPLGTILLHTVFFFFFRFGEYFR